MEKEEEEEIEEEDVEEEEVEEELEEEDEEQLEEGRNGWMESWAKLISEAADVHLVSLSNNLYSWRMRESFADSVGRLCRSDYN